MNANLLDLLIKLEKKLHSTPVRSSKEKLNELLHDEFLEIGSSGKIYNKNQTIDLLLTETPYKINATDYELRILSKEVAKLKYKTKKNMSNNLIRTTLRNSLWKFEGGQWKMIFHQGTVVSTKTER